MPARTGAAYIAGLREHPPEVHLQGERVKDVTSPPGLRHGVRTLVTLYDMQHDPALRDEMTYASPTTGDPVGLSFITPRSHHDLERRHAIAPERRVALPSRDGHVRVTALEVVEKPSPGAPLLPLRRLAVDARDAAGPQCVEEAQHEPRVDTAPIALAEHVGMVLRRVRVDVHGRRLAPGAQGEPAEERPRARLATIATERRSPPQPRHHAGDDSRGSAFPTSSAATRSSLSCFRTTRPAIGSPRKPSASWSTPTG
jgi:hypothetical protein